jgi:hypothetical protein
VVHERPAVPTPAHYEKLGLFYLGRPYDIAADRPREGVVLYDSRDLTTHAFCVGMTGSGKTGLCVSLIEEAALDGVPAIAIDPKGDVANLLLTFPELRPSDLAPWIDAEEAARKGVSPEQHAAAEAERWREGLAEWGQDPERIRRLRSAAEFAIYTPGSSAGIPLSIVRSLAAPSEQVRGDPELLRERATTAATGLLALLGVGADPLRSGDHILVSAILTEAWRSGRDLDLATLIHEIEEPPFERIGAMDVSRVVPAKDRAALATKVNALLGPTASGWLEGEPLDVGSLLWTPEGRPRISIISIAHLSDGERMFVLTLLLNEVLAWMRSQPGTASLRAILYIDEIFGLFPPVAEPPSKRPLLSLLKQARAFGLGIVLATQNTADLDYKGLANTGTWLIGRLQTDRDRARVLDGLEGAAAADRGGLDRATAERTIADLPQRVFLLRDVHEDAPVIFQTRWALSYLRGPLTRDEIRRLMEGRRPAPRGPAPAPVLERVQKGREARDDAVEALRRRYGPRVRRAEEKLRSAAQKLEREEEEVRGAGMQTAISAGAAILTAVLGRKSAKYTTVGRATTAARGAGRVLQQRGDVQRAKEDLEAAQRELDEIGSELEREIAALERPAA